MKIPASLLGVMLIGLGSVGVMGCAAQQAPVEKTPKISSEQPAGDPKSKPSSVETDPNPQPETPQHSIDYCPPCGRG